MNGEFNKGKGISLGRSHCKTDVSEGDNAVAVIAEESRKFIRGSMSTMEIKMITGCLCDSLTINGTEEINLSEEKKKEVLEKVLKIIKPEDLNELLWWLVPKYAQDYECSDTACDCCGDYIDTYTLTI